MTVNETGIPDKPFIGARGPRKSRPQPRKPKRERKAAEDKLFTEERHAAPAAKTDNTQRKKKRKKVVLGAGWSEALERMANENMTMTEFVATLSPEELARGRIRNPDGTFRGAPSKWVPAEFHKECIRELLRQGKELYQVNYIEAIQSMVLIANSPSVEPAQRIKAATFVIERIEGKVPERLEIGTTAPWQELLTGIVASVEPGALPMRLYAEGGGDVIEGEVESDEFDS